MPPEITAYAENGAASEEYVPQSPFLESYMMEAAPKSPPAAETLAFAPAGYESPFRAEYMEAGEAASGTDREAFAELVTSFYESEFSEAIYELAAEVATAYSEQSGEQGEVSSPRDAEAFMESYISPLMTESEAALERLAEQYASKDIASFDEAEVERLLEAAAPSAGHLSAGFENFFGSLWNKVKSVAKGAVNLAKKGIAAVGKIVPLGWLFDKLKGLIRPLLRRVLGFAIGRLPTLLQPIAKKLAQRLFGEAETGETGETTTAGETTGEALAHPDPDSIQREFDARVASLFFARDEGEIAAMEAETSAEAAGEGEGEDAQARLEAARDQFVRDVTAMERGQDPTPALEQFIPALWPVLKLGLTIVGRQRVVGFLAGFLSKAISPYVGAQMAPQLSNAIVSTGMTLFGLETPPERETLAGEALAGAVEGTVRRLAEQGEAVFEDQRLLEAAVAEAFEAASAESFPPEMLREPVREVADTAKLRGTWIYRPARGRRRYRRYTQPIDVVVTPRVADSVVTFGHVNLGTYLRGRLGVTPPIKARAYLFEAVSACKLSTIARLERGIPGLGPAAPQGWKLFHPLTRQAAAALLGEPGLGRDVASQFLQSRRRVAIGQRFYVLVPAGGVAAMPTADGRRLMRPSEVNCTLDFPRGSIRIALYLGERDTQTVAAQLRKGQPGGAALTLLRNSYEATLRSMFSGSPEKHVKVIHEAEAQEQFLGAALAYVGKAVLAKVVDKLIDWVGKALSDLLVRRAQEVIATADRGHDGLTIVLTYTHPGLIGLVDRAIRGQARGAVAELARALTVAPQVDAQILPGFRT
jgi:hypothetical protein